MGLGEVVAKGASVVAALAVRLEWDDRTGNLEKVRVLGIPVFDRRRWNARQERRQRAREHK